MPALSFKKKTAAGVVAACVLVGGAITAAFAAGDPSAAAAPAQHARAHHVRERSLTGILARADHATFEVRQHKAWVTITVDRGRITTVSASSITLLRPDGHSVTIALGATTHFRGGATSLATVTTGRSAVVISEGGTAHTVVELKLRSGHHKPVKPGHASPATPNAATPNS